MNVDEIWEKDAARQWEEMNMSNEFEQKYRSAAYDVNTAHGHVTHAVDSLYDGLKEIKGTPAEDKIKSLMDDLENLGAEISAFRQALRRGEA